MNDDRGTGTGGTGNRPLLTTNQAVPVADDHNSLTAGTRGPTLMEDLVFREKMMHFDHERIPERVVHPRGSGAHGYFEVYEALTEFTCAAFLQDPSIRTPVFVRFSTVVGFRGSADTVRDARGFATKFYTSDGNFDLVGNNMPVFFIQDAMKFPDLVHAVKPEPHDEMPQASAAHDNFWDFASLMPESTHMLLWVLSDRAIPRSYRMMEGFGVHTFRLIDAAGRSRFVKFHWKPVLGVHGLVWDEAQKLAGKDPDFHRRDLWEAIDAGDFPEFELGLQIIEEDEAAALPFDVLDPTKLVPEELVPVRRVGRMVLDRNPDNFFAETEQVAFHPGHLVPGIDVTNDPLLQGRLFSYLDTQLTRLGGPNFAELPINRPLVAVRNNQRDGFMRQAIDGGRVNYEPSSLGGGGCPVQAGGDLRALRSFTERMEGRKTRERSPSFADHFSQATLFWNSQSDVEKDHIVAAVHFELGKVRHPHIRQRICDLFFHVDPTLARRAAAGLGVTTVTGDLAHLAGSTAPRPADGRAATTPTVSPALSTDRAATADVRTRAVMVVVADGYDERSLEAVRTALTAAGARSTLVAARLGAVTGAAGTAIGVDKSHPTTGSIEYDAVMVCGGATCAAALRDDADTLLAVREAFRHAKTVAAFGDGLAVLDEARLAGIGLAGIDGDEVLDDQGVVSAGRHAEPSGFAEAFVAAMGAHRHWHRNVSAVPA